MKKYKISILGCGAIFSRHLQAISSNSEYFELVGLYDIDNDKLLRLARELNVKAYSEEDEIYTDPDINCIAIITPSNLHYLQMEKAIRHNKNVIIEKPATFFSSELDYIIQLATQQLVSVFAILQVRLNPSIIAVKNFIKTGAFGKIRNVALVQRWQRPHEYFTGWRGTMYGGGGTLREFSIHYLDALMFMLGTPNRVTSASFYKTKFIESDVYDTVYAHLDFGSFGGNIEISIGAEPKNLECSLSIMSEYGFIKLGGKSLDEIIDLQFLDCSLEKQLKLCETDALKDSVATLANTGASPYHPELYRQIAIHPERFGLQKTRNVIKLIEDIYTFDGLQ